MSDRLNPLAYQDIQETNIVFLNDIKKSNKLNHNKKLIFSNMSRHEQLILRQALEDGYKYLIENPFDNYDILKECFERACYILYDRVIMQDIIDKQKNYPADYVGDFLTYILRIFFNHYEYDTILSKNQCSDIKKLCINFLDVSDDYDISVRVLDKLSSKQVLYYLKDIIKKN